MIATRAFTLLELVIVVALVAVLAAAGAGAYRNMGKGVEIQTVADVLRGDLRHMQSKAMIGEDSMKWGVHVVNGTTDYYELFSTPTNYASGSMVVFATTTLPGGISWSDPGEGSSQDIIFNKVSGGTTASSVVLVGDTGSATVSVSDIGTIY